MTLDRSLSSRWFNVIVILLTSCELMITLFIFLLTVFVQHEKGVLVIDNETSSAENDNISAKSRDLSPIRAARLALLVISFIVLLFFTIELSLRILFLGRSYIPDNRRWKVSAIMLIVEVVLVISCLIANGVFFKTVHSAVLILLLVAVRYWRLWILCEDSPNKVTDEVSRLTQQREQALREVDLLSLRCKDLQDQLDKTEERLSQVLVKAHTDAQHLNPRTLMPNGNSHIVRAEVQQPIITQQQQPIISQQQKPPPEETAVPTPPKGSAYEPRTINSDRYDKEGRKPCCSGRTRLEFATMRGCRKCGEIVTTCAFGLLEILAAAAVISFLVWLAYRSYLVDDEDYEEL